jgi:hypothetical protein
MQKWALSKKKQLEESQKKNDLPKPSPPNPIVVSNPSPPPNKTSNLVSGAFADAKKKEEVKKIDYFALAKEKAKQQKAEKDAQELKAKEKAAKFFVTSGALADANGQKGNLGLVDAGSDQYKKDKAYIEANPVVKDKVNSIIANTSKAVEQGIKDSNAGHPDGTIGKAAEKAGVPDPIPSINPANQQTDPSEQPKGEIQIPSSLLSGTGIALAAATAVPFAAMGAYSDNYKPLAGYAIASPIAAVGFTKLANGTLFTTPNINESIKHYQSGAFWATILVGGVPVGIAYYTNRQNWILYVYAGVAVTMPWIMTVRFYI